MIYISILWYIQLKNTFINVLWVKHMIGLKLSTGFTITPMVYLSVSPCVPCCNPYIYNTYIYNKLFTPLASSSNHWHFFNMTYDLLIGLFRVLYCVANNINSTSIHVFCFGYKQIAMLDHKETTLSWHIFEYINTQYIPANDFNNAANYK